MAGLTREQKIGFSLLLIFAVLAIGLGVLQIRNTMYKPFALSNKVPILSSATIKDTNALRYRDTDKDGLNDFDELYVYQTSPYLDDTDSDGATDAREVQVGTNPLCASGKECVSTVVASGSNEFAATATSSIASWIKPPATTTTPLDLNAALQDPTQVRQLLINAGVDKSLLDKVTDSQLQILVNDVMKPTSTMNLNAQNLYNNLSTSTR